MKLGSHGYPVMSMPGRNGPLMCHLVVAEAALGHALPKGTEVHHIDENKLNFSNNNLVILQNRDEHAALHRRLRVLRAGGKPWTQRLCSACRKPRDFSEFYETHQNTCMDCQRTRSREYQRQRRRSVLNGCQTESV